MNKLQIIYLIIGPSGCMFEYEQYNRRNLKFLITGGGKVYW